MAIDTPKLAGRRIQIAGSASRTTDIEIIRYAHRLVSQVVRESSRMAEVLSSRLDGNHELLTTMRVHQVFSLTGQHWRLQRLRFGTGLRAGRHPPVHPLW